MLSNSLLVLSADIHKALACFWFHYQIAYQLTYFSPLKPNSRANWVDDGYSMSEQTLLLPCSTKPFGPFVSSWIPEFLYTHTLSVLPMIFRFVSWQRVSYIPNSFAVFTSHHILWMFNGRNGALSSWAIPSMSVHHIISWLPVPNHGARNLLEDQWVIEARYLQIAPLSTWRVCSFS